VADHGTETVTQASERPRVLQVTTCRSDYGPAYWVTHELHADPRVEAELVVAGAHLDRGHGMTVREVEADGWPISERVPFAPGSEDHFIGRAVSDFATLFRSRQPDIVLVLGDRLELLAIATAAVLTRTPIAHISGGEVTEGALDEQVRHAVTKMAHVHFPGTPLAARRVRQLGEEPWRIHQVGDPALDHFSRGERATDQELVDALGFLPDRNTLLVTQHAASVAGESTREVDALIGALRSYPGRIIITAPAPDPGSSPVREAMIRFASEHGNATFIESLGSRRYRAVLERVSAMIGNSSSGLIEAASAKLPVVNVGERQQGRERGINVIDTRADATGISEAIGRATSDDFRRSISDMTNVYGDGTAARKIVDVMATLPSRDVLLRKRFVDVRDDGSSGHR
jgi:UDP-hydrolysing UDP-N-acetyl-D-glucosamine 2-epimerase